MFRLENHRFERQLSGLHFRVIENVIEQSQQALARVENGAGIVAAVFLADFRRQKHLGHPENAVHRGSYFMRHCGQEATLGDSGSFGCLLGLNQGQFVFLSFGDVADRTNHPDGGACGITNYNLTTVMNPDDLPIRPDDPMFRIVDAVGFQGFADPCHHRVAVIRVNTLGEK